VVANQSEILNKRELVRIYQLFLKLPPLVANALASACDRAISGPNRGRIQPQGVTSGNGAGCKAGCPSAVVAAAA
jgi:hypothetical protein